MAVCILERNLPFDLVETITRNVHKMQFAECMNELVDRVGNIETLIVAENPLESLSRIKSIYPDMVVYMDSWGTWHNMYLELIPGKRFIYFEYSNDFGDNEITFMCEIAADPAKKTATILREFHSNNEFVVFSHIVLKRRHVFKGFTFSNRGLQFENAEKTRKWFMKFSNVAVQMNMPDYVFDLV